MPPFHEPTPFPPSPPRAPPVPADLAPPPPPREVATGVANLGNTCYMNAALQALAHAPELCHALDAESHLRRCPVARRNERRRRARREGVGDGGRSQSQSHRRSDSGSSGGSAGSGGRTPQDDGKGSKPTHSKGGKGGPPFEFCTLCEVEKLLGRVHARPACAAAANAPSPAGAAAAAAPTLPRDGPVSPEAFVAGFMSQVAPWFRRGVQEDSHEFLRLLIDAMQRSCRDARRDAGPGAAEADKDAADKDAADKDTEYPFRLFRGTVESNVRCSACSATSVKIDPIEDIGLDVLPAAPPAAPPRPYAASARGGSHGHTASLSSSRSASPTAHLPLVDVQMALERFIRSERLDSGYKCEQCGKLGKATKTSKLASIPPILTLHLKRFRYGAGACAGAAGKRGGGRPLYADGAAGPSSTRSGRAPRGSAADRDHGGPAGSAKIEGHVRIEAILDVKPYLTPELQRDVFPKQALCRLFAVVVHTGKNSHSGHYVAFVHNVSKKEWWKMDDARIVRVAWSEVQSAEAYMLFYRVTTHPVARRLREAVAASESAREARRQAAAARAQADAKMAVDLLRGRAEGPAPATAIAASTLAFPLGKRARPFPASGEEWLRDATTLAPEYLPLLARIQAFVTEHVTFSPEYVEYVTTEYRRMLAAMSAGRQTQSHKRLRTLLVGKGPAGVCPQEDVQGGVEDIQGGILDLFNQISMLAHHKGSGSKASSDSLFLLPIREKVGECIVEKKGPAVTAVPALTIDHELIIPPENTESYDGAL